MKRKKTLLFLLVLGFTLIGCQNQSSSTTPAPASETTPTQTTPPSITSPSTPTSSTTTQTPTTPTMPSSSTSEETTTTTGSSSTSSEDSSSTTSSSVEGNVIPVDLIGTWEGNDGSAFYRLVIDEEKLVLNNVQGEVIENFREIDGGYRGKVAFQETTYIVDYFQSPYDSSVYVQLAKGQETFKLYNDGKFHGLSLPDVFKGTWEGINLEDTSQPDKFYTIIVDESGNLTMDSKKATIWTYQSASLSCRAEIDGKFYTIAIISDQLSVQSDDGTFTALMDKKEEETPDDPQSATYLPEDDIWFGTWTDGTHTLTVSKEGIWTLDGKEAEYIKAEGSYITIRFDMKETQTSYYLSLTEIEGKTCVKVEALQSQDPWILEKEIIPLPAEWVGTWRGKDASDKEHTFIVQEDGSFLLDDVKGSVYEVDSFGVYTLIVNGEEYKTNTISETKVQIFSMTSSFSVTFEKEQEIVKEPIEIPEVFLGTWEGSIDDVSFVLTFNEDDTFLFNDTLTELDSLEESENGTLSGTFTVDDVLYTFSYVKQTATEREHVLLAFDEQEVLLNKKLIAVSVTIPEELIGEWKSTDTTPRALVVDETSVTLDGTQGIFLTDFVTTDEGDYEATIAFDGIEYTIKYGDQGFGPRIWLDATTTSSGYHGIFKKEEVVEEPVELPSFLVGTWTTSDESYTLVIGEDSSVTLNKKTAEKVDAYTENDSSSGFFFFTLEGTRYRVNYENTISETIKLIDQSYTIPLQTMTRKAEESGEEENPSGLPAGLIGTWTGTDPYTNNTCVVVVSSDGTTTVD